MPIPIEKEEPPQEPPYESCCFCDAETEYWTTLRTREPGEQVACCPGCARAFSQRDVPTKEVWCSDEKRPRFTKEDFLYH